MNKQILNKLEDIIRKRYQDRPEGSYTTELFEGEDNKIIKKFGEEFTELVMASTKDDRGEIIYESADMLYHFLVLLRQKDINLEDIYNELNRRFSKD
jgi:phosphoribosyl-ATP pyrophosphohydrolase/phosphoribosyl-AMP cyclohydrolase